MNPPASVGILNQKVRKTDTHLKHCMSRLYGNKSRNEVCNDTSTTCQGYTMNPVTRGLFNDYIPACQVLANLDYVYLQHSYHPNQNIVLRFLWSRKNYLQNGLIRLYLRITQPPRLWGSYLTRNLGGFFVPAVLARPTSTGRMQ